MPLSEASEMYCNCGLHNPKSAFRNPQYLSRHAIERVESATFVFGADGALDGSVTEALSEFVHGLIEFYHLFAVFEKIDLLSAADQMTEANTDKADEHAALIKFIEQFFGAIDECLVVGSIRDP